MHSRSPVPGSKIGSTYMIPCSALSKGDFEDELKTLTLQAKCTFGVPPPPHKAWNLDEEGNLHVPRFYGLDRFGRAEKDERTIGDVMQRAAHVSEDEEPSTGFVGTLTPVQVRAKTVALSRHLGPDGEGGAIICLPCGFGKTVWAVNMIAELGRKACVLVHKSFLRDQWTEAFQKFCPSLKVGYIQGKTWDVEGADVVIAMVMTVAKREYDPSTMDCFGLLCIDECHHMAAPVMSAAMLSFRARYIIGLTATKERPDGLTPLLHWSIGPESFRAERDSEKVKVTIALLSFPVTEVRSKKDGKMIIATMLTALALNKSRNEFLVSCIMRFISAGRTILVLSDRIKQLELLYERISSSGGLNESDVGMFTSKTKEMERKEQLSRRIVFCSYGMANEGLDKKDADTCIMATPKGRVTQCIGRVQRPCDTKKSPIVLDVVDDSPIFSTLRWQRQRMYSKEQYRVQVLRPEDTKEEEWFV